MEGLSRACAGILAVIVFAMVCYLAFAIGGMPEAKASEPCDARLCPISSVVVDMVVTRNGEYSTPPRLVAAGIESPRRWLDIGIWGNVLEDSGRFPFVGF